jgi:predicted N-acetyltransferase YhbS
MGEKAVFVLGNPSFYSRFGFTMAAIYGLHYRDSNFDSHFMVLELVPNTVQSLSGDVKYLPPFESI